MFPRKATNEQDKFVIQYANGSLTDDATVKLMAPSRRFKIDAVKYINPTGLVEDDTNFFNIKVMIEAVLAANWSTDDAEEGTIAADTFVDLTLAANSARVGAKDDEISVVFDEDGAATLPAGLLTIECSYL